MSFGRSRSSGVLAAGCLAVLAASACTGFGPGTMRHQQADYAAAVADAAKRQTLMNLVRLRYGDVPAVVGVNQIVAGYSLQGTFSAGTELLSGGSLRLSDDANIGVGGTFTNTPTITYAPVTGADFARIFLAPLPPADLFGLTLAGISPQLVLGLGLHSIAGYDNRRAAPGSSAAAEPGFAEVLALLLELQRAGRLVVRLDVRGGGERVASIALGQGEGASAPERRLRRMLGLPGDRETFEVVYTLAAPKPGQIAIRTRSLLEVMGELAGDIKVPAGDVADGRTFASAPRAAGGAFPSIVVRHGPIEPRPAFVAAPYGGRWFWIDDRDLYTKRVFSFVMLLLSLSESSRPGQAPVITIPAG